MRPIGEFAVSKLYHIAWSAQKWAAYQTALKKLTSTVDGVERQVVAVAGLGDHDAHRHERRLADGLARSAVPSDADEHLQEPRGAVQRSISARCGACRSSTRVFSLVNGGRARESDLFEGLR